MEQKRQGVGLMDKVAPEELFLLLILSSVFPKTEWIGFVGL